MSFVALLAIATASAINAAIPGPCVALTLVQSARGGTQAGLLVTAGLGFAVLILCSIALAITQGVLVLSAMVFLWMKWLGVCMLVVLALLTLRESRNITLAAGSTGDKGIELLVSGVVVGLSSPFNLVFFLSLLPQFVPLNGSVATSALAILTAVLAGTLLTYTVTTLIGSVSAGFSPGIGRKIERFGALSMLGFAALAATAPTAIP